MEKRQPGTWHQAPNALYNSGLDPYEIAVLGYICRCAGSTSNAFPSYAAIAAATGMSRRQAMYCIDKLTSKGILRRVRRRRPGRQASQTNLYSVHWDRLEESTLGNSAGNAVTDDGNTVDKDDLDGCVGGGIGSASGAPGGACGAPGNRSPDLETTKPTNKGRQPANSRRDDPPVSFNEFKAMLNGQTDMTSFEVMNYFVSEYRRWRGTEHPKLRTSTWLRQLENMLPGEGDVYEMIDHYFRRKYQGGCDYGLCHFNTESIKEILFYETRREALSDFEYASQDNSTTPAAVSIQATHNTNTALREACSHDDD